MKTINEEVLNTIEILKQKKISLNILTEIFELHFKHNKNEELVFNRIHNHFVETFKFNPSSLLTYLAEPNLELHSDDEYIKGINELKYKYGFLLREEMQKMKHPFLLTFAETNVEPGASEHKISFKRADGKSITATFTPDSMLPILSLLTNSTKKAINEGIYKLNEEIINVYFRESDQLISLLKNLISHKEDQ